LTTSESRRGTAERPTDVDPALLEAAEFHQRAAAAARDALVAAQAEIAPLEAELNRTKVRVGNAIRRLYQAGPPVSSIARALDMGELAPRRPSRGASYRSPAVRSGGDGTVIPTFLEVVVMAEPWKAATSVIEVTGSAASNLVGETGRPLP
jgi:hypothetical protein